MPLDATGHLSPRVLTEDEARDLAILKAARRRLRHRWMWWQGGSWLWRTVPVLYGGRCAMQAVMRAARDEDACLSALIRLAAHLPAGWSAVHLYNDHRTTTHADILALYDRAIAELE